MIYDIALGVGSTVAGINAGAVDARIISCTLAVRYTLGRDLRWYALGCRIADVTNRAPADRIMIVDMAQRVPAARIASDTRIYAERIYALLVARTFAVRITFWSRSWQWSDWNSYAFYISIAGKVLRTEADTSVRCGFALRVKTALSCQTGIYAFSVQTRLVIGAILI